MCLLAHPLTRYNPQFYAHRPVEDDDSTPIHYITPDVVLSVLVQAPFAQGAMHGIPAATQEAWGPEFSAEVTDSHGIGIWADIKLPTLIVEYVKDDTSDHRGHLAMAMKSALAVYRLYQMREEVVFGLLVNRERVSLAVGWDCGEGNYVDAKVGAPRVTLPSLSLLMTFTQDYVCFQPTTSCWFDLCVPQEVLRLRLALFNIQATAERMLAASREPERVKAYLIPFMTGETPESVRWKEGMETELTDSGTTSSKCRSSWPEFMIRSH